MGNTFPYTRGGLPAKQSQKRNKMVCPTQTTKGAGRFTTATVGHSSTAVLLEVQPSECTHDAVRRKSVVALGFNCTRQSGDEKQIKGSGPDCLYTGFWLATSNASRIPARYLGASTSLLSRLE